MLPLAQSGLSITAGSSPTETLIVGGSVAGLEGASGKQATSACRDLAGSRQGAVGARERLRQSRPSRLDSLRMPVALYVEIAT